MPLRDVFIAIHALAGIVAFVAGAVAVMPSRGAESKRRWFPVFAISLGLMVVFLAVAIVLDWGRLTTMQRVLFPALFALAVYMALRARDASLSLAAHPDGRAHAYIDHMAFVLISLFEGLVIVGAVDLLAPGWLVVLVAASGAMAGVALLPRLQSRAALAGRRRPTAGAH